MIDPAIIAKKLGLPDAALEDEAKFEAAFNDTKTGYIARAKALEDDSIAKHFNDQYGTRLGQIETLIRKVGKEEIGIEEIENGPIESMITDLSKKTKARLHKLTEDGNKDKDTRVIELTTQANALKANLESEKERADNANKLLEATKGEFENYKTSLISNQLFQKELGKIELIPDMTELQKKGFNALVAETFEFKLDKEGETLEVYKKGEAKRAKNEAGNQNLTVEEALKSLAEKNGLLKKNNLNRETRFEQKTVPQNGQSTERQPRTQRTLDGISKRLS